LKTSFYIVTVANRFVNGWSFMCTSSFLLLSNPMLREESYDLRFFISTLTLGGEGLI